MKWWAAAAVVALPGGGLAVGAWWFWKQRRTQMLTDRLREALPLRAEPYARALAEAAILSCPLGVDVDTWALRFCAIIDRESQFGVLLSPRGPTGTGDGGHGRGLGQVDDRPASEDRSEYEQALSQKRMQHIDSGAWMDPTAHLRFCAVEVFRGAWEQFGDLTDTGERLDAAAAAYNAGVDRVRRQLDAGGDVDSVTTQKNYAADTRRRAEGWA